MIISFNPTIFQSQDCATQQNLAEILTLLMRTDIHFVDIKSISTIFFNTENKYIFNDHIIAKTYLSLYEKQGLQDYFCKNHKPVTQLHKKHITRLTIGSNSGEMCPRNACKIIKERSLIIVENYPNDWKFVKGIVEKYKYYGKRKSIYELIKKALDEELLTYDHAGGSGIKAQVEGWVAGIYADIHKFKLLVIFDSDKTHKDDFKNSYKNLIEYLKGRSISIPPAENDISLEAGDFVIWHMLFKRCIENYVPLNIIFEKITNLSSTQENNLLCLSPSEIDFIQYYSPQNHYISIGKNGVKEKFPEMFLANFSCRLLEQRCEHHKDFLKEVDESVSEFEQILLKIAKII